MTADVQRPQTDDREKQTTDSRPLTAERKTADGDSRRRTDDRRQTTADKKRRMTAEDVLVGCVRISQIKAMRVLLQICHTD
jgi:hypothetical protein